MSNEKGNFRSSLFGGFNRRDVADYIEKLSAERNRYKAENSSLNETVEKLQSDIEDLNAQIKELSDRLETTCREPLGLHIAACEDAIAAASKLKTALSDKTEKIKELSESVDENLSQINKYLASLPSAADKACNKIGNAIERLNELKNEI